MATTGKVNADDQHLEDLTEIGSKFDTYLRALLDGNMEPQLHNETLSSLGGLSAQLAELVGFMKADVAKAVAA